MMRTLVLAVLASCWTSAPPPPSLSNQHVAPAAPRWEITERGLGPLGGSTTATEEALKKRLPAQRVATNDLGAGSGIVYDVFDGSERLLYVVPDDAPGWTTADETEREYAATMFALFAVSGRVTVAGRRWRVGEPFDDIDGIDFCECWGGGEVTACFKKGSRIRVIFEEACEDAKQRGARAMLGKKIDRIMWKRELEPADLLD